MPLLALTDAYLSNGHQNLLENVTLSIDEGERIGLIGRNGAGKSTLLQILAGQKNLDRGKIVYLSTLQRTLIAQHDSYDENATVFDVVASGVAAQQAARLAFESASDDEERGKWHEKIETLQAWNWEQRVKSALQQFSLAPNLLVNSLSGGLQKRVALARGMVSVPDLLLLDEPTNHLDLNSILWLQELLINFAGAIVVISHDRAFLNAICTRIVEVDRGDLLSFPGNLAQFQIQKNEYLKNQAIHARKQSRLLTQEEKWIRKGVEARRTRAQGRITRLEELREWYKSRKKNPQNVKFSLQQGDRGSQLVAELENVSKRFERQALVDDFTIRIVRGEKIGLVGPNGCGKTTLLRLILGDLQPDQGTVKNGAQLSVAYFDQFKSQLNSDSTIADFISPGSEWIEIGTQRKHVKTYLADFLFLPEHSQKRISQLSGGEKARLLLARLFAQTVNVLVLDEPTNDLDIETLELLEELLLQFEGTVFLVSHDREFLTQVVTSVIQYSGQGKWTHYQDELHQAIHQAPTISDLVPDDPTPALITEEVGKSSPAIATKIPTNSSPRRKLGYLEQREIAQLPEKIEQLEQQQQHLATLLSQPNEAAIARDIADRLNIVSQSIQTAYSRWDELLQLSTDSIET